MIIGIDGNEANIRNRVGVNQYAYNLLATIRELQDEWKNKHRFIVYLSEEPLDDLPKESDYFKYKVLKGKYFWIITKLTPYLFLTGEKPDVIFSPSHYVPFLAPVPRVCSIMDLGYLKFSEHFKKRDFWQLKIWTAYSLFASKQVIAISNATRRDIVRHYPFTHKKIAVTRLGYDNENYNTSISPNDVRRVLDKYHIVDDYILFVGTLKPSKNVSGLIEAFKSVSEIFKDTKLVIVGKKGWLYDDIFKKVEVSGLKEKIIFTDFIPEGDKPAFFAGAKLFILPSFWEGFGLDVLNAMACGIPVVLSERGSIPEVAGDAGIYFNPKDSKQIAEKIISVLSMDKVEYSQLKQKVLTKVKEYSWEKTTRQTLTILEKVKK